MDVFYSEAKRVLKPGGSVAVWGYTLCSVRNSKEVTEIIKDVFFKFNFNLKLNLI